MASRNTIAAIFKRGGQKPEYATGADDAEAEPARLDQHLQQMAQAWATPKLKKGLAAAVWRPGVGAFEVIDRGRHVFAGQGFMHNRKLYLNIEEALYLMDRAFVLLMLEQQQQQHNKEQQVHHQETSSMQPSAGQAQPFAGLRLLSMQEALHMMELLGVSADRLSVLSYLGRLGFTTHRHPACWQCPPQLHPATTWQVNPAWAHTDGLPLLVTHPAATTATAAAAAAAEGPVAGRAQAMALDVATSSSMLHSDAQTGAVGATCDAPQPQQQPGSTEPLLLHSAEQPSQPGGAASGMQQPHAHKRRRVQQAAHTAAGQPDQQMQTGNPGAQQPPLQALPQQQQCEQQQQQHGGLSTQQWYAAVPHWLQPSSHVEQQPRVPDQQQEGGQQPTPAVPPLLGLQLQQQFPLLRPLQRYRDMAHGAGCVSPGQWGQRQAARPPPDAPARCVTSDVVFDVLVNPPRFSYKTPPSPHFSIAMMRPGCTDVPCLDEILDLSLAVAAPRGRSTDTPQGCTEAGDKHILGAAAGKSAMPSGAAAAAAGSTLAKHTGMVVAGPACPVPGAAVKCVGVGGSEPICGSSSGGNGSGGAGVSDGCAFVGYQPVKYALPEEGDVSFCELVPIRLMDLLTN